MCECMNTLPRYVRLGRMLNIRATIKGWAVEYVCWHGKTPKEIPTVEDENLDIAIQKMKETLQQLGY